MSKEQITLAKDELKRVMVIEKWIDDHLTEQDVVRNLGISVRQAYRLKVKYRHGSAQAIAHGNRGRKPAHTLADSLKQHVQHLYQSRYLGSNSTHLQLLAEHENIRLSVSSVRRILIQGGLRPARYAVVQRSIDPGLVNLKQACCGKSMPSLMPGWRIAVRN
jgi:transposase